MTDTLAAFFLVFLAELGDKSMVLAVALAARYRPAPVLGGIAIAAALMLGVAALLGAAAGATLPATPLALAGGTLFLLFGVWTLNATEDEEGPADLKGPSVLLGVTAAFLIAEFGDKTMLATAALASTQSPPLTWVGASAGMTAASGLAIGLTRVLGARLSPGLVQRAAAAGFLLFGILLIADGVRG